VGQRRRWPVAATGGLFRAAQIALSPVPAAGTGEANADCTSIGNLRPVAVGGVNIPDV
jgi:hypothetical protein